MHDSEDRQRMGIWRKLSWNSSGRSWRGDGGSSGVAVGSVL